MGIKYRILSVDNNEHTMVVRYWSDDVSEDELAIDLLLGAIDRNPDGTPKRCRTDYNIPVWQTPTPSPEDIIKIIENAAPVDWLILKAAIKDPAVNTDLKDTVLSMIGTDKTVSNKFNKTPPLFKLQVFKGLIKENYLTEDESLAAAKGVMPTKVRNALVLAGLTDQQVKQAELTWAGMTLVYFDSPIVQLLMQDAGISPETAVTMWKSWQDL